MEVFRDLSKSCYRVAQKTTEKRSTDNNLSISYEFKEVKVRNKRPSENELWLWRDWREFRMNEETKPKYSNSFIAQ
jgi:hypothetical protein